MARFRCPIEAVANRHIVSLEHRCLPFYPCRRERDGSLSHRRLGYGTAGDNESMRLRGRNCRLISCRYPPTSSVADTGADRISGAAAGMSMITPQAVGQIGRKPRLNTMLIHVRHSAGFRGRAATPLARALRHRHFLIFCPTEPLPVPFCGSPATPPAKKSPSPGLWGELKLIAALDRWPVLFVRSGERGENHDAGRCPPQPSGST